MPSNTTGFRLRRPGQLVGERFYERVCQVCGARFIASCGSCPDCGGFAKSEGEMTKKVIDDSDLKKGF